MKRLFMCKITPNSKMSILTTQGEVRNRRQLWPNQFGHQTGWSRIGGPLRPNLKVLENFWSRLPSGQLQFCSLLSGQHQYFGRPVWSGQYHFSVCSVWPIPLLVWPKWPHQNVSMATLKNQNDAIGQTRYTEMWVYA